MKLVRSRMRMPSSGPFAMAEIRFNDRMAPRREDYGLRAKAQAVEQGEWPPRSYSEEKVKAATGKGWMGWFVLLNNMDANALPHKDVVKRLKEEHGAPNWWSQMIAVEYERAR